MKVWTQDGQPVEMEAVDGRECVIFCGYSASPPAELSVEQPAPAPAAEYFSTDTGKASKASKKADAQAPSDAAQ